MKNKFTRKNFLINGLVALIVILISMAIYAQIDARRARESTLYIETSQEIWEWYSHYQYVDMIAVSHNSVIHRFCTADNHPQFNNIKTILSPFGRSGFGGDEAIDMNILENIMQIAYYVGTRKLFEAGVYILPGNIDFHSLERRVTYINGSNAVVVLDSNGWFGGFEERAIDIYSIIYANLP